MEASWESGFGRRTGCEDTPAFTGDGTTFREKKSPSGATTSEGA